jgi:hypothetical protein
MGVPLGAAAVKTDLVKPCANCPFRRNGNGVKLHPARIEEIHEAVAKGFAFLCHKTVKYRDDEDEEQIVDLRERDPSEQHCAGAAAYAQNCGDEIAALCFEIRYSDIDGTKVAAIQRARSEVYSGLDEWKREGSIP